MLKILLLHSADVTAISPVWSQAPIHCAARASDPSILETLFEKEPSTANIPFNTEEVATLTLNRY